MNVKKLKRGMKKAVLLGFLGAAFLSGGHTAAQAAEQRQIESLDRGLVAVKTSNGVYLSWRLLGTDDYTVGFHVYRNGQKIAGPITDSTNYLDKSGKESDTYTVRTVVNDVEKTESDSATVWGQNYLDVPIEKPADVDGATYSANDATVADVDNDGDYEIILKWDPSNSKDNSQSGQTSNVYIDCYEMDGTRRWRIDLGKNIRAGAHYTQFMVYDFNGDGYAEMAVKTADGTVAGDGTVIGDASKDYRNSSGYVLDGPEYLTLFEGRTGKILDTINYEPARGTVSSWGDKYGNRVDRFLAGVAYLDGKNPYLITCRGYYTRAVIVAYRYKGGKLNRQWTFDTNSSGNGDYAGQGNHNLTMADVDNDGKDEIVYGSCVIDDNGKGLYSTKMGHGDAMHVSDFDPDHEGLEVFQVHEDKSSNIESVQMRDAKTGTTIWSQKTGTDVGRGIIANIGPDYYPYVVSCSAGNFDKNGNKLDLDLGKFGQNFLVWWDGDLYREGLDRNYINKYNYNTKGIDRLLTADNVHSNNSTKATPSLSGDILGDWREEVIWPTADDTALRIYTTTTPTEHRLYTLMSDIQYRTSIAWQNVAYNQPPHTSYYMGEDMKTPTKPNVWVAGKYKEKEVGSGSSGDTESTIKEGAAIEKGLYMIQNVHSGQYLEVADGKAENAANVQQWGANGSASHNTWWLEPTTDGYYHLYSQVGDKSYLLDLDYGKKEDGTNIQIYQDTKATAQEFKFVKNSDDTYKIVTRATDDASALVVADDSTKSGANICQWTYGQMDSENWKLIPVTEDENPSHIHTSSEAWRTNETEHWHVCTECGEVTDKAAHTMVWVIDKEPTVTTEGRRHEQCSVCGRKGKIEVLEKLVCTHANTEIRKAKNATDKKAGYSGDVYCKDCGKCIEKGHKIPKTKLIKGDVFETYAERTMCYKVVNADTSGKGTLKLVGTKGDSLKIEIPSTVTVNSVTYKVTGIADKACKGDAAVETVTIADSVKVIGDSAFEACTKLKKVTIGKNVTSIGEKAFYKDKKLADLTIKGEKVKVIEKNAIGSISSKAVITVPSAKKKAYKKLFTKQTGYRSMMTLK
ncbi:MAG: RICIN domain-containing protein [Lachnospiraceae bacterium]